MPLRRCLPIVAALFAATLLALPACSPAEDEHAHDHDHDSAGHDHPPDETAETSTDGHAHTAPHGGTLLPIGDHFAHLELVLDEAGRLTLYILDGEAQGGIRVEHETLALEISEIDGEPADFTLTLDPVASSLTGETVGDSSQFEASDDRLANVDRFTAELPTLTVRGQTLEDVPVHLGDSDED